MVPQKPIGGVVGVTVGNAPYKIGDRTERVIGVAVLAEALHSPAVFAFLERLQQFDLSQIVPIPSH